jgi:hypothetical protein
MVQNHPQWYPYRRIHQQGSLLPQECHVALIAHNPSYASLTITQLPSWVRSPSSYTPGTSSSLCIAFEDQDGIKLRILLTNCYLFCFSNRATVRKWKQRTPSHTPTTHQQVNDDDDVKFILNSPNKSNTPIASKPTSSKKTTTLKPPTLPSTRPTCNIKKTVQFATSTPGTS